MKKRGFTLIELLAVIVILAIIALIATPIVLNIIKDSKESATLRSAELYLGAVEQTIVQEMMDGNKIEDGTYEITKEGNICLEKDKDNTCKNELKIDSTGKIANEGIIQITNGKISKSYLKIDDKLMKKADNEIEYMDSLYKGKLTYSKEDNTFLLDSMIDLDLIKPKTNYKMTLTDSNKEKIVIDNLSLYAIEGMSLLGKAAEDYYPMLMCSSEAGACAFMYEPLNPEQEYEIKIEDQNDKFIPYQFVLRKVQGSSSASMYFYTMNIEKGVIFDLLIKDEDNNIYFNEVNAFRGATGDLIGKIGYSSGTYNSTLNSMFQAVENNKKITMTLTYYDIIDGKDIKLNGKSDEYIFTPKDAVCTATNSSNECIEYGWGNPNLFISD